GRRERPVAFAAAVERLATFARPEVEVILGLPGDTPEGFRQTVRFVLDLPAAVSVYRLRLDPWSRFLERRAGLGLEADFADMGRIRATPTFPPEALADAEAWLEGLAQGPWFHRARGLSYDGRELVRP
ncbi:MAG: hypothetical protein FJ098_11565, partial [Deltaproteobacteria bacterium]|nr:hypothetical protein [Deltaproteobacteria bacterium]